MGHNEYRVGSVPTLWQDSVTNWAVRSGNSICRIDGNPAHRQLRGCFTGKGFPHTHSRWNWCGVSHIGGTGDRILEGSLVEGKSICPATGNVDSQFEVPFSLEALRALRMVFGSLSITYCTVYVAQMQSVLPRISDLTFLSISLTLVGQVSEWTH